MRALALVVLAGCVAADPAGAPVLSRVERVGWKIEPQRAVDLLFVVDSSPAMAGHEARWAGNQRAMMAALQALGGELPSVHIGVITTDLGTSGHDQVVGPEAAGCHTRGDRGDLRIGGAPVQGMFLADMELATGDRQTNYVGALADVFAEIASVGTQGCPYVQPLEAMARALGPRPSNAGFLRPDAFLWIVFVTPNDDCSFARGGFAVDSAAVNAHECFARTEELVDLDVYEDQLRRLKSDPTKILISLVAGASQPVTVVDGPAGPEVAPACANETASALPARRLAAFANRFQNRSSVVSICHESWNEVLSLFAPLPTRPAGNPCFASSIVDREPEVAGLQAECTVSYRYERGGEDLVAACRDGEDVRPCWRFVDARGCTTPRNRALEIVPVAAPVVVDTYVVAECVVEGARSK